MSEQFFAEPKIIDVAKIRENEWNPNEMNMSVFKALVDNIKDRGFKQPILVRRVEGDEEQYEVVDGAHRFRAVKEAGLDKVLCVIVEADENEAKLDTIAMNNLKGEMMPFQLAQLIVDLKNELGEEYVKKYAGFTEEEIKNYEQLLIPPDIDEEFVAGVEESADVEVPVEVNIMLYKNQKATFDEAMERAIELTQKPNTIPLVNSDERKQVDKYDKAMQQAMKTLNTKRRSEALEYICEIFLGKEKG